MGFREKAALFLLAYILYETACSKCMPQSLRNSPFERYINKQRYSSTIPTTQDNGRETHGFQDDLTKLSKLYRKLSPLDVSDSFINNLRREKRTKRKLQRAQKVYTRDNDEILTIPASFHNQGPPLYLSEVGLFPEVKYPLSASDTWAPIYWNSLPANNHDRFLKNDAYFTDRSKSSIDSIDIFKQKLTAKYNKKSEIKQKTEEILKHENNKKCSGVKSNKIVRQTTASLGQKNTVDSLEQKDGNEMEKYLMQTPKLTENTNTPETSKNSRQSTKNEINDSEKGLNQTIFNVQNYKTQTKGNNLKNKITTDKKTLLPEEMSKVTEQENTSRDNNPENLKCRQALSPKTKNSIEIKRASKKSSSINEVISHFSKLIMKLEQLSNKHQITSVTTSNKPIISSSPTNGTSESTNHEEPEIKIPAQNSLTNILQVETKMSKKNIKVPEDEKLNIVQLSDKSITSDEGAETAYKTSEEKSDLPFSFKDYVVRNQLLDVVSDPNLSITSLRNGIFKILEAIDCQSVEELDENPLLAVNEASQLLPLNDEYLKKENLKSLLPDRLLSNLDKQDTLENFNEAILPSTNASDSSSEIILKSDKYDDIAVNTQQSDNVLLCKDDPHISDKYVTGSLAENLRNVISEPSSSNSLIEELREIIRLLTVWNSHINDSDADVHATTKTDKMDSYLSVTTKFSSQDDPTTFATHHSYEVISDSGMIKSIKDETNYSCDNEGVMDHLRKAVNDSTEGIFKPSESDQSNEDVGNYSCENNHELNALEYSRGNSANYSCKDNYKCNETEYSKKNMANPTYDDIHSPNATEQLKEDVVYSCEYINKYKETKVSYENMAGIREDILKHNTNKRGTINDICSFNLEDHSNQDQTESFSEEVHRSNVSSCEGVIYDSCEHGLKLNLTDYSNENIHKPNTTRYDDSAHYLYKQDKSKSNATNFSCDRIQESYAKCYSSEIIPNYSCEVMNKSSDTSYDNSVLKVTDYSNDNINSLKVTVISSEVVNYNSCEEICKPNITEQSNEGKTKYSYENIHQQNATVYSSEDANDGLCKNMGGTREDITKSYVNVYSNDYMADHSYEYKSTSNVSNYYSNKDETKNSSDDINEPNAIVYSCGDVSDCSNECKSSNVTYFLNEEGTEFLYNDVHKLIVTQYSNEDVPEYPSEDTYKPKSMVNKDVNDYSDDIISDQNVSDHSNKTLVAYACEVTNISCSDNPKLKTNVTDHSNEIFNDLSSEDIAISNLIKRKVKNMAKFNMLEHNAEHTEKYNINNYFSETRTDHTSNDLFIPNPTNYSREMFSTALENIPKANVDESNKRIPESSRANRLKEEFEIVADFPTIYHIPFEKLTNAINDKPFTIPIDVDDQTVNDKVTEDFTRTSDIDLSNTTPLPILRSFTYNGNKEIPEAELVTFEKFDNIISIEPGKIIASGDNFTADYLPVYKLDDVFKPLSDDSENPIAFVSTFLPFDENILKLHNETEMELFENYLPIMPNGDKKAYDEVCPITANESTENQCFMIDDPSYFNNTGNFTNPREYLLNPIKNNLTELFGDNENPDLYDSILCPEEYEFTETSGYNDTRELHNDAILDFTDYTVLPEDTTLSEYYDENYIETLATTINPFDQYDDIPVQNEESNVSDGSSKSNQIIHKVENRYETQGTFEPSREVKTSTDYTSLPEHPNQSKYFEEEPEFRPLYERNVKPLLHRDLVQHH